MTRLIKIYVLASMMLMTMFVETVLAQTTQFPIIAFGCPADEQNHLARRDFFAQIDSANFNTIYSLFSIGDFDSAQTMGLKLIQPIYHPFCEGQTSVYESDQHANPPGMERFSHANVTGHETLDDSAGNIYAWLARTTQNPAGDMQRDLLVRFNKEQNVLRKKSQLYNPHTFFADFRMRTPTPSGNPPDGNTPIVSLSVLLSNRLVTDDTLAAWQVVYNDFVDSNAVGAGYADFRLRFRLSWKQDQQMNRRNPAYGLDYRVYWYDNADVYLDRVTLQDTIYTVLINGGYDSAMNNIIAKYNSYYPETLFRWYLRDEAQTDMFPVNRYVNDYLQSQATAKAVQATGGGIARLGNFISSLEPSELAYNSYPFSSVTDTSSDNFASPNKETLQTAFDDMLNTYAAARRHADDNGLDLWFFPQAHKYIRPKGDVLRFPTNNELKCQVFLSLAYGAKGLFYFMYPTDPGFDPTRRSGSPGNRGHNPDNTQACWIGSVGLVWYDSTSNAWVKTLTDTVRADTMWCAVRDVNRVVNLLSADLLNLKWQDCFSSEEAPSGIIASLSGSFTPAFIQVGAFKNVDAEDCFLLVNRRCLAGEQQDVTVTLTSSSQSRLLEDILSSSDPRDENPNRAAYRDLAPGENSFVVTLNPGEGRLFRVTEKK